MSRFDFNDTTDCFPSNVVQLIVARMKQKWPNTGIFPRPLRHTDKTQSMGVFPVDWSPDGESYEFQQAVMPRPTGFPTIHSYRVTIQAFVKDTDSEKGIRTHAMMSKAIRSMLYFDAPLAVGLRQLSVEMDGVTETIQKRMILGAKYISNEINGTFLFISTLQYSIETENK
jgi:hypothetical protein